MTSTVHTSVHLGLSKGQHRTVFRNPRGNKYYYSFFVFNTNIYYEYSTDGVTWSVAPIVVTSAYGNDISICFDVKMHDDGSQLEVWVAAIGIKVGDSSLAQTRYIRGTISDAGSTISWGAEQTIDASVDVDLGTPLCIALARTDNAEIVVAFTEDDTNMGKDYRQIKLIGSDGDGAAPNWSGEVIWDDPSGDNNNQDKDEVWFGLESFSSSYPDDFLIYARVPDGTDANDLNVATAVPNWDQGGAGFTNTTQATWATAGYDSGACISGLIDEADIVHLVYLDIPVGRFVYHRKSGSAGDDDLGGTTTIESTTNNRVVTITLDTGPATDELYVFYETSAATVDWLYKTSPVDVISWSSEKTVSYHQDIIALTSWNRVIENSLHVAGLYGTTVIYNEHPVYKALSTTLADLEFPDQNYYLGPHDL